MNKPADKLNIISLHLGAGSSLCAISQGKSVDTTMGFTPLEGLMMTTRSGNLDPGIILFLQKTGWSLSDIDLCLNRESGLLGVSGISDEMTEVIKNMTTGDKRATLAINMFVYRINKVIGSYYLILKKVDAVSFTGWIGENADIIRNLICRDLDILGIKIDNNKNQLANAKETEISSPDSGAKIFVIPGNEKLLIARDVVKLIKNKQ